MVGGEKIASSITKNGCKLMMHGPNNDDDDDVWTKCDDRSCGTHFSMLSAIFTYERMNKTKQNKNMVKEQ